MTEPQYLVPATVEFFPLDPGRARLSILFTNGQRGKLEGSADEMRDVHTMLLDAMSAKSPVDLSVWPKLRVGSGFEWDW
jgi:hypothetical protein